MLIIGAVVVALLSPDTPGIWAKKTYSLESGPHHIPIDDYVDSCNWQYSELLSRSPSEPEVQRLLGAAPLSIASRFDTRISTLPLVLWPHTTANIARSEVLRARLHVDCFSQPGLVSYSDRD